MRNGWGEFTRTHWRPIQTPDSYNGPRQYFAGLTAALIMGGLAAAGSIGGAAIQAHAATSAADKQSAAAAQIAQQAKDAAATATQDVNTATDTANTGLNTALGTGNDALIQALSGQITALAPYINSGQISLGQLQDIFGPNGPLSGTGNNNFSFTPQDWANDPGYAYLVDQQNQALQRSAAATGGALGGGYLRAASRLTSNLASTHLDSAFNRALATYNTNRQNLLYRISGLQNILGTGLQATGLYNQDFGNTGQLVNANIQNAAARIASNTTNAGYYAGQTGLDAARIAAQALSNSAAAQGAASIASGNAWNNAIGGTINAITGLNYSLPRSVGGTILGGGGMGGTAAPPPGGSFDPSQIPVAPPTIGNLP